MVKEREELEEVVLPSAEVVVIVGSTGVRIAQLAVLGVVDTNTCNHHK